MPARTRRGGVLVAANGGVINFEGETDPSPPRYIQLTHGLLYLRTLQAARLLALEMRPQRRFAAEVERQLRATGESLAAPTF